MTDTPASLLLEWLERQVPAAGIDWVNAQLQQLVEEPSPRVLYTAVGLAPRKLGRDDLHLGPDDLARAENTRPGWDPSGLSVDAAVRILFLLSLCETDFAGRFSDLCRTAEVGELIAFYSGLPLYSGPERLVAQACEGLRSNMRVVFEAVALRSSFPAEQFTEAQWNQMVLKAVFVESPLHLIQKLDERSNPELAAILCDYARERVAAGRPVPVELWRCVGPHADEAMLAEMARAFESDDAVERKAAALALSSCQRAEGQALLATDPHLKDLIDTGRLTWSSVISEMANLT